MAKHKKKIRLALIFGGKSAEHEVSLNSARNVFQAVDKTKYSITLVLIDKRGNWWFAGNDLKAKERTALVYEDGPKFLNLKTRKFTEVEAVFPILHGTNGEDGTIQGLFEMMGLPYVGPGVLGSAVGMDKEVAKRLMIQAGIPTPKFLSFSDVQSAKYAAVKKVLGSTVFVKPANLGSSVGISKARNEKEFKAAVKEAFKFDTKIIVEEFIKGREIECSVLGNEKPRASLPGEILPEAEFYTYEAKYSDSTTRLEIPVKLTKPLVKEIRELAAATYKTLCLEGMTRVDFFLTNKGKVLVNEVNTIPGFTNISMYPKLWEASGIKYSELIDRLIQLAMERHQKKEKLKTARR